MGDRVRYRSDQPMTAPHALRTDNYQISIYLGGQIDESLGRRPGGDMGLDLHPFCPSSRRHEDGVRSVSDLSRHFGITKYGYR